MSMGRSSSTNSIMPNNGSCILSLITLQYELRLAASDNLKENYTTVVIHVKDVNDNPPVFERPTYRTQITEEDDRNLPKRVLQAGVACLYFLQLQPFIILPSRCRGRFFVYACQLRIFFFVFSFLLCVVSCMMQYELTLVASDSLNENETTVVVHIKDVNDLPPFFNRSIYVRTIEEEFAGSYPLHLMQVSNLF